MLAGCSKDEILNHYNNIVQSAGSIELTGKSSLQKCFGFLDLMKQ